MKRLFIKRIAVFIAALGLMIGQTLPAYAQGKTAYYDAAEKNEKECSSDVIDITSDLTEWNSGWFRASGTQTISKRVSVKGEVNLILDDECSLVIPKGIYVPKGAGINIYAKSKNGSGKLYAGTDENGKTTCADYNAGIGGNGGKNGTPNKEQGPSDPNGEVDGTDATNATAGTDAGTITIYGGNIFAKSGKDGAAIGGGAGGKGGVGGRGCTGWMGRISGGKGHKGGKGGNGGAGGAGGKITIYGGTINAEGIRRGTGIGGGAGGNGGTGGSGGSGGFGATFGGDGGEGGAGGAGGKAGAGGNIAIYGGTVNANASECGTGIGGGAGGNGGAGGAGGKGFDLARQEKGKKGSAGNGGNAARAGNAESIIIDDGNVTATCGKGGTGIGGGRGGSDGNGKENKKQKETPKPRIGVPEVSKDGTATINIGWAEENCPVNATNYNGKVIYTEKSHENDASDTQDIEEGSNEKTDEGAVATGPAVDVTDTGTALGGGTVAMIGAGCGLVGIFIGMLLPNIRKRKGNDQ